MSGFWQESRTVLVSLGILIGMGGAGLVLDAVFWRIMAPVARRTPFVFDDAVVRRARKPTRLVFPLLVMHLALPFVGHRLGREGGAAAAGVLTVGFIVALAWLLIALINVIEDVLLSEHRMDVSDNLGARKLYTQVQVLKRVLTVVVVILAAAAILMSFKEFRQIGTGILASAGVAGIVLGFAAQKTIGNLIAGIHLAVSQPIRIDDVLIVEGEWGRVEEITLTFVVLRIWDLRRLIIPIGYFIEKPFQNWTRVSADLLGTVFVYADYTFPVESLRPVLHSILKDSPNWDGKVEGIQVTDANDRVMEVRALMSAADSSKLWDLRCLVREKLIEFLRAEHPGALPRFRAELERLSPGEA